MGLRHVERSQTWWSARLAAQSLTRRWSGSPRSSPRTSQRPRARVNVLESHQAATREACELARWPENEAKLCQLKATAGARPSTCTGMRASQTRARPARRLLHDRLTGRHGEPVPTSKAAPSTPCRQIQRLFRRRGKALSATDPEEVRRANGSDQSRLPPARVWPTQGVTSQKPTSNKWPSCEGSAEPNPQWAIRSMRTWRR